MTDTELCPECGAVKGLMHDLGCSRRKTPTDTVTPELLAELRKNPGWASPNEVLALLDRIEADAQRIKELTDELDDATWECDGCKKMRTGLPAHQTQGGTGYNGLHGCEMDYDGMAICVECANEQETTDAD